VNPRKPALVDAWAALGYARLLVEITLRAVNVLIALVTLASAVAVLVSDVLVAGYRAHHRDALWFVAAYAAVQVVMVVEFARGGRLVPWLALAKAAAAYFLLANFLSLWPEWRWWTPARYVYQLFDWGKDTRLGLFTLVFLGRGTFNTLNAMYFTRHWWGPLRVHSPLLGRALTAVPIGVAALCVWAFLTLVREEATLYSADAREVAELVVQDLECDAIRAKVGTTTEDLRQRGARRYHVQIAYGCPLTRVTVRTEDGRSGAALLPRPDCCPPGS